MAVFVEVHAEDKDVGAVDCLEEEDAFRPDGELGWEVGVLEAFGHFGPDLVLVCDEARSEARSEATS